CSASERSPRLLVARPVASLMPTSATAASTEARAVLRCGLTRAGWRITARGRSAGSGGRGHLPDEEHGVGAADEREPRRLHVEQHVVVLVVTGREHRHLTALLG